MLLIDGKPLYESNDIIKWLKKICSNLLMLKSIIMLKTGLTILVSPVFNIHRKYYNLIFKNKCNCINLKMML